MKFLYFGDRHYTYKQPKNRIDDFLETSKLKDEEIIKLGKKYNVSAFLQPGDFFEEKDINGENEFLEEIINRWNMPSTSNLLKNIKSGKDIVNNYNKMIPIIGVAGNHDLIGNSFETLPQTTLGLFQSLGLLKIVSKENPIFFETEDGLKIAITGTSYHLHQDDKAYINDYIVEEKLGDIHIHIVHGMLSEKDMGPLIAHTTIDEIKNTKADITLCGHNHLGFGIKKINDRYFVNIGSVTRFTGDYREVLRIPSVALIDITKDGIKIEEINLKTAKNGIEVIDRTFIEEDKKKKEQIEKFRKEAESMKTKTKPDMSDFVENIAKNEGIPDVLKDDIIDRLLQKEKENNKIKNKKTDSYVKKIILENFQSHKYNEFELSPNLNIFIGESNQGKSSVLRAFYWVYENKPAGKGIIKRGEDYCQVTIVLSDDTMVSRLVESKSNGKNSYEIIYPDGSIETGNTKLLEKVQQVLGFNNFYIDKQLSLPVNFYKQGESWYLINKDMTSTNKARIIGALSGTNLADAVSRDLDSENNKSLSLYKLSLKRTEDLNKEIKEYEYLDDLKTILEKNKILLSKYDLLSKNLELLKSLKDKVISLKNDIKNEQEILDKLNKLDDSKNKLSSLIKNNSILEKVEDYKIRINQINKSIDEQNNVINKTQNIELMKMYLDLLKRKNEVNKTLLENKKSISDLKEKIRNKDEIISKTKDIEFINDACKIIRTLETDLMYQTSLKEKINSINQRMKELKTKIENEENIINNTKNLSYIKNNIKEFYNKNNSRDELVSKNNEVNKIKQKIQLENDKLIKAETNLKKQKENYEYVLKEINICPICKEPLDEHKIKEMIGE